MKFLNQTVSEGVSQEQSFGQNLEWYSARWDDELMHSK